MEPSAELCRVTCVTDADAASVPPGSERKGADGLTYRAEDGGDGAFSWEVVMPQPGEGAPMGGSKRGLGDDAGGARKRARGGGGDGDGDASEMDVDPSEQAAAARDGARSATPPAMAAQEASAGADDAMPDGLGVGSLVEVAQKEEGYIGAWFQAEIVAIEQGRAQVKYTQL